MLCALVTVGSAFAGYKIEMKNDTADAARVEISYVGGFIKGLCNSDSITLQAGEYKSIDVGLCCTSRVVVTSLGGLYANLPYEYMKIKNTCGGFGFTITKTKFGGVIFTEGASLPRQGTGSRKKVSK
jgi:hypothetical protein